MSILTAMRRLQRGILATGVCLLIAAGAIAQTSSIRYDLFDLGTLGGLTSAAFAVNNRNTVVGSSLTANNVDRHAFAISAPSVLSSTNDLGTLGGSDSIAYGISEAGWSVGESQTSTLDSHAFLYYDGTMNDLGTLGGRNSAAFAINASKTVVGASDTEDVGERHAFAWTEGVFSDLGTLGGDQSEARSINDLGQIVGWSRNSLGDRRAFLSQSGGMSDLLAGIAEAAVGDSAAWAIDDSFVVGQFTTLVGDTHAFRYDLNTLSFIDLGTLGGNYAVAYGTNSRGDVVGASRDGNGDLRGFLWTAVTGIVDLNHLLVKNESNAVITAAYDINDSGFFVGVALVNGSEHAVFGAPEPSTALLLFTLLPYCYRKSRKDKTHASNQ